MFLCVSLHSYSCAVLLALSHSVFAATLGCTQPPKWQAPRVKQPEQEPDRSSPTSAESRNLWSFNSTSSCISRQAQSYAPLPQQALTFLLFLAPLLITRQQRLSISKLHHVDRGLWAVRCQQRAWWRWRQFTPPPWLSMQTGFPGPILFFTYSFWLAINFKLCIRLHRWARPWVMGAVNTIHKQESRSAFSLTVIQYLPSEVHTQLNWRDDAPLLKSPKVQHPVHKGLILGLAISYLSQTSTLQ